MREQDFSLGRTILRCSHAPEVAHIAAEFTRFLDEASPNPADGPHMRIRIRGATTLVSPLERGLEQSSHFDDVQGFCSDESIELWDGHSLVCGRFDGSWVDAQVAAASDEHTVTAVMLFVATAVALRAHGLFHLHAACVDSPRLGATLIVGESGAGKSTSTLSLVAAGARLVSDDAVFLADNAGKVHVRGWPTSLHLGDRALQAFPDLARHVQRHVRAGSPKWQLPRTAVPEAQRAAGAASPQLIVVPQVERGATRVIPLPPEELLGVLLSCGALIAVPGAARAEQQLRLLGALSRTRAVRVLLGEDALTPGTLEQILLAPPGID